MSMRLFQAATLTLALCGASTLRADELVLDLKTGKITQLHTAGGGTNHGTTFAPNPAFGYAKVKLAPSTTHANTWEAIVEINLAPGGNVTPQKRANFLVEYDGNPQGWTVHVGDDAINDGYGGGGAEFQVLTQVNTNTNFENTYFGVYAPIFGGVDKLVDRRISVKDGALRFTVANQEITLGSPYEVLQSGNAKNLIALPGASGDMRLYAAFNRVINGRPDRTGTGARRVIISTEAQ